MSPWLRGSRTCSASQWLIRGRGWHQEKWATAPPGAVEGLPRHDSLSAVSPEHPVILTHASGHATFANALAMRLAGITKDTVDPEGGGFGAWWLFAGLGVAGLTFRRRRD